MAPVSLTHMCDFTWWQEKFSLVILKVSARTSDVCACISLIRPDREPAPGLIETTPEITFLHIHRLNGDKYKIMELIYLADE